MQSLFCEGEFLFKQFFISLKLFPVTTTPFPSGTFWKQFYYFDMKTMLLLFACAMLMGSGHTLSQVGVGTITPSTKAMLEVSSTSNNGATFKGFMPPRVASIADRDAINPGFRDFGLMVFTEATGCLQIWDGDSWEDISCVTVAAPDIWINEIHYDNIGTDVGEGFEIAGAAGTDASNYEVVRYNGADGTTYSATIPLSGTIPNQGSGFGTLGFVPNSLQNGIDGIALVHISTGNIVQFLSYEGSFIATDGPAMGMLSEDIGVQESNNTTPVGTSMQLVGTGNEYVDFTWSAGTTASFGARNSMQTFN